MTEQLYNMMNWADIEEIEYVDSLKPKRILGMHEFNNGSLVQAFIPHAVKAAVTDKNGKEICEMERADEDGFYAAWIDKKPFDYKIRVIYDNDFEDLIEDPYNPKFKTVFTEEDYKQFGSGIGYEIYDKLGAHPMKQSGVKGVNFAVFAPEAKAVSVVGDFNLWDGRRHQMEKDDYSGIFELFIPGVQVGDIYKFEIKTKNGTSVLKADPYASYAELRPNNASVVWETGFEWSDSEWIKKRKKMDLKTSPMNIYEVHLGSWRQRPLAVSEDGEEINGSQFYNYREIAHELAKYVKEMGYTHIEIMPVMEHPLDGSWGYQVTGYFAPTSRYGTPDDFMYFMNYMHNEGIGVILDWVPAHFPKDDFGLALFDGSHVYEHADPRKGEHPHWGTLIFNYAKPQVTSFLVSNALYWVEKFHADGIRIDAVASMLYLDYGRNDGEWVANMYGGKENLEAIEILKHINSIMHKRNPGVSMIAEESTAWPMITGSLEDGGLGFDFKWNMGFMNDFLHFMQTDPYFRKDNYGALTFSMFYNYSENFVLVFSHDEVVHLKGSMLSKMPSAELEVKAQHLRAAYAYYMTHPDKKLLFMGQDFAQNDEWQEWKPLEWELLQYPLHKNMQKFVKELNALYLASPALWQKDYDPAGFGWINCSYNEYSMVMFMRKTDKPEETLIVISNFDNVAHEKFRIGVPFEGSYKEILNSDDVKFGGTGVGNPRAVRSKKLEWDDFEDSISINIPAMSTLVFKCTPIKKTAAKKTAKTSETAKKTAKTSKTVTKTVAKTVAAAKIAAEAKTGKKVSVKKAEAEAAAAALSNTEETALKKEAVKTASKTAAKAAAKTVIKAEAAKTEKKSSAVSEATIKKTTVEDKVTVKETEPEKNEVMETEVKKIVKTASEEKKAALKAADVNKKKIEAPKTAEAAKKAEAKVIKPYKSKKKKR